MKQRAVKPPGFTLVEMLVVIAIIGVLVALILPAVQSSRESGRRTTCINNMKQIALAVANFETNQGSLPLAYSPNNTAKQLTGPCDGDQPPDTGKDSPNTKGLKRHSVLSFILPYMERREIYEKIDFALDYNASAVTKEALEDFHCPSADTRRGVPTTDYTPLVDIHEGNYCEHVEAGGLTTRRRTVERLAGMLGDTSLDSKPASSDPSGRRYFDHRSALKSSHVRDGLSHTFLLFESAGRPNHYVQGQRKGTIGAERFEWASDKSHDNYKFYIWGSDANKCPLNIVMNCDNESGIYSFHPAGAVFAYGDGSVSFVSDTLDTDTFICMFTRAASDKPIVRN